MIIDIESSIKIDKIEPNRIIKINIIGKSKDSKILW